MIYAIGDLHLPFGVDKPMDIFPGWTNHVERLRENWNSKVTDEDTVVVVGDHSWALKLEESRKDLEFIDKELNGRKILSKGNHDLWWSTMKKVTDFAESSGFSSLSFLFNNAFLVEGISICGTRGWISENGEPADQKVLAREAGRLEMSLQAGVKLGGELTAFIHYPPIYGTEENVPITEILHKYNVKRCYYAHLHGYSIRGALNGERGGVSYKLVSADSLGFDPIRIN
ncbi:MAG: metallophosphoesterase [Lachnospiraceae bacterium]|nr:metallophosphoesterase [Ruminococcus sp.]MCM1275875.1 metallophosphoesterase [Lachnospiraceae bacterium]